MRTDASGARVHAALAFVVAAVWIVGLVEFFRPEARDGVYFHAWTSEYMVQTLPLGDLRREPVRSLWYNHIQPPLFDAIRATIASLYPNAGPEALMRGVDLGLQRVLAVVYAATALLVFVWVRALAGIRSATIALGVFLMLPGPIFYATFLDSTALSALLILWFHYEWWRFFRADPRPGIPRVLLSGALLVLTRSVFQWPFVIVVAAGVILMTAPGDERRRAFRAIAPLALFMGLYVAKQYALFGLTITSSFGPDNFCKGLSEYCHGATRVELPAFTDPDNAIVLRRAEKLNGEYNYNQMAFLRRSFSQMEEYRAHLRRLTPARVAGILSTNAAHYLRPTSRHSDHLLVDRLPWRGGFERAFSGAPFLAGLVAAALLWLRSTRRVGDAPVARRLRLFGLGLALPVLYVAAVTIVFESGENMRFRFFLEPTLFVFLAASIGGRVGPGPPTPNNIAP